MSFGGYETSFLLSGLAMGAFGLFTPSKPKERVILIGIGAGMVAYSVYVANQTSGLYMFPVQLLILPWVFLAKLAYDGYSGGKADKSPGLSSDQPPPDLSGFRLMADPDEATEAKQNP